MIEKSFLLIRTNPSLTGNIKVVVDTNYNLYLESFDANQTLRNKNFKHFPVKNTQYLKEVISTFFSNVDSETIYDVKNTNDISETYTDYQHQYDDTYFMGAQFVSDNSYKEEYEYTAPLYIKNDKIPSDFIIFRVDGIGSTIEESSSLNFRESILNNLKFIKGFDLTKNSDLGKWLDMNYVSDNTIPKFPMFISHDDLTLSQISGIDVKNSGWTTKYFNINDVSSNNMPIFHLEEYITNLWKNNNLLYPNILNFKFLFDDTPATQTELRKYSINRYVGFYIDEKVELLKSSPFKPYELNIDFSDIIQDATIIPYVFNNAFVKDINGRKYSFDPIKNGWVDGNVYWVEYGNKFYNLQKVKNDTNNIIGDYLYNIVSDIKLVRKKEFDFESGFSERVLINDFGNDIDSQSTTYKNRIVITPQKTINNIVYYNVIENSHKSYVEFKRTYISKEKFQIEKDYKINKNIFQIENFDLADVYLINIDNKNYSLMKDGDVYFINTDYAISVDNSNITTYINNGFINKDANYYTNRNIDNIKDIKDIPYFSIFRLNLTDVKDFDFDRVETNFTKYEYEQKFNVKQNIEPKFYAKEFRDNMVNVYTLNNVSARRIEILDENNRPYLYRYNRNELNDITKLPYKDNELFFKDNNGVEWQLFSGVVNGQEWGTYKKSTINLKRPFYREENYIWKFEDKGYIDFISNSDNDTVETLTWGTDGMSLVSDMKTPLPMLKSSDPNDIVDDNCIPVSSEYINSDELWELRNNELTSIWNKNQNVVKWGAYNSLGSHDYSYRLNYNIDFGLYNNQPNANTTKNYPERKYSNLDYFYRFGLTNKEDYQFYSLHLDNDYFDIDKYLPNNDYFDYFEYLFKSDQLTSDGIQLTNKYSLFSNKNEFAESETIFRGLSFSVSGVSKIVYDNIQTDMITDILTVPNTNYNDYRFSIVFGKKRRNFDNNINKGIGNSNMGVDIYLNDYWKNVIIHVYIDTDETIKINNTNAETCEIDEWYKDVNDSRNVDSVLWDNTDFKINNISIGLKPRDFKLLEIVNYIQNYNFVPNNNINKNKVNYIHIDKNMNVNKMDINNTNFIIKIKTPKEIILNDKYYSVNPIDNSLIPNFEINNSLENRKITKDITNNPVYTLDGLLVGSVNDINTYNNYPIAKTIDVDINNKVELWDLDSSEYPSIYRFESIYSPIFKDISLFRPYSTVYDRKNNIKNLLPKGNWKFYDNRSDISLPNLKNFATLEELIFSKCNEYSSILKIDGENGKEKSVYPMVDEYGYDFDARYLFASSFESNYNYISNRIDVPTNTQNSLAGYTIHFDGVSEKIVIPDQEKFNQENFIIEDVNYMDYIDSEITGESNIYKFQTPLINSYNFRDNLIQGLNSDGYGYSKYVKLIKDDIYKLKFKISGTPTAQSYTINFRLVSLEGVTYNPLNSLYITGKMIYASFNGDGEYELVLPSLDTFLNTNETVPPAEPVMLNEKEYLDKNIYNIRLSIIRDDNPNSGNGVQIPKTEYRYFDVELTNIKNRNNILDIQTDKVYLNNNKNGEYGNILLGSYIKREDENDLSEAFSYINIAKSLSMTMEELDLYDYSENNQWRVFASKSSVGLGRKDKVDYDYNKYPIPKNWNGETYISILNKLRAGSGDNLSSAIKGGSYGYNSYVGDSSTIPLVIGIENILTDKEKFDRSCLYHFIEYGSQDKPLDAVETDTNFTKSLFGAEIILNEFYKMLNIGKNYISSYLDNSVEVSRLDNNFNFNFEPDNNTHLENRSKIVYSSGSFSPYALLEYKPMLAPLTFTNKFIRFTLESANYTEYNYKVDIFVNIWKNNNARKQLSITQFIEQLNDGGSIDVNGSNTSLYTHDLFIYKKIGGIDTVIGKYEFSNNGIDNTIYVNVYEHNGSVFSYDVYGNKIYLKGYEHNFKVDIVYGGENDNLKLIQNNPIPSQLINTNYSIDWYKNYRDTRFTFDIIDNNNNITNIDIDLYNLDKTKKTNDEIVNEINNDIFALSTLGYRYQIYYDSLNDKRFHIKVGKYPAPQYIQDFIDLKGSYYNFNILLVSNNDFVISESNLSSDEVSYTEKIVKTSIIKNRKTGRLKDITLEFWVKADAWVKDWETILYKGLDTNKDVWVDNTFFDFTYIIGKFNNTNLLAFKTCHEVLTGGYQTNILTSKQEINDGEWHHICLCSDLLNRKKQIYIDGILDNEIVDFLDITMPDDNEMFAQFIERRKNFIPFNDTIPNIGIGQIDEQQLANKIRQKTNDTYTNYWTDVMSGKIEARIEDLFWQYNNWNITIDVAYKTFKENYLSMYYYLNTDINDTWDIIIASDSIISNSKRNFEGFVDELRIWNYVRSNIEIFSNYRNILTPSSYTNPLKSLIFYLRFDEGQGSNFIKDLTDGYLVNDVDRMLSVKKSIINNGFTTTEKIERKYYNFIKSYTVASVIPIDDSITDWGVSHANLIHISDERSVLEDNTPVQIYNKPQKTINNSKNMLVKRNLSKISINTKKTLYDFTIKRSYEFKPFEWWILKSIDNRKNSNLFNTITINIERKGNTWLDKLTQLTKKKR